MFLTSLVPYALVLALAAAKFNPISLQALASGTDIQFASINANGAEFWIGKKTATFCPVPAPECASFSNKTVISVVSNGMAFMSSTAPGGQDIYVKSGGALSFTEPHEEGDFPKNSLLKHFTYTKEKHSGGVAFLGFKNGGVSKFFACPVVAGKSPYQIFLNTPGFGDSSVPSGRKNDCIGIGILAVKAPGSGAFEYE